MTEQLLNRVVFAHDHVFQHDTAGEYFSTGGQFGETLWARYLVHAAQLTVVARSAALNSAGGPQALKKASDPRVQVCAVPSLSSPVHRFSNQKQVDRVLREALTDADLLIARLPSQIGRRAVLMAERMGKPWCLECVGCAWDAHFHYGTLMGRVYAPLAYWESRALIQRAPLTLYVTREFLQRRYPTRGVAIACSDVQLEEPALDRVQQRNARIEGRAKGAALRFGLIGSLGHSSKGLDVALRALSEVKSLLPPFEFWVLGLGNPKVWQQEAARWGLEQSFRACGTLPVGQAVWSWLDEVDLYLQPSRQEGLPRALIEAMSRGCPALGSRAGGIPELLPPECLHEVGDHRALGAQIVRAVSPSWQQEQARRNQEVAGGFSASKLEAQRAQFWQQAKALAGRAAGGGGAQ